MYTWWVKGWLLSPAESSARDILGRLEAPKPLYIFMSQMDPLGAHHYHNTIDFQERVGMKGFEADVGSTMWHGAADLGLILLSLCTQAWL